MPIVIENGVYIILIGSSIRCSAISRLLTTP